MINSEKAAYLAPAFQNRRRRTLKSLLSNIHEKFFAEAKKHQKPLTYEAQALQRPQSGLSEYFLSQLDSADVRVINGEKKEKKKAQSTKQNKIIK